MKDYVEPIKPQMKEVQVGFIIKGGGLNEKQWAENAEKEGLIVKECEGHYELYRLEKAK